MTTFADMTPQERAQCKGLWCSYETPTGNRTAILYNFPLGDIREKESVLFDPKWGYVRHKNTRITLRNDLPRAWNADSTPPTGEWQTAKAKIILNVNAKYDPEQNVFNGDGIADPDHEPRSSHDIRRWIGDWETIEEGEEE